MFCHIMRRRLVQLPVLASPFGEVQGKDEQQQKTRAQRKNMWFERVNTSVAEYQLDFIPHLPLVFHVMFFFHPTNWTILTVDCWQMFGLNQVFSKTRKKVWPMCRPSFFFSHTVPFTVLPLPPIASSRCYKHWFFCWMGQMVRGAPGLPQFEVDERPNTFFFCGK